MFVIMSAVKGTNPPANNIQTDSIKKKVHFEQNDADDIVDHENKFPGSPYPALRLRSVRELRRNDFSNDPVFTGKYFTISPSHILLFPNGQQDNDANTTLILANDKSSVVAFKVKTTAPSKYRVRPGNGILAPGGKAEVIITLLAGNSVNDRSQDKFLVLGMEIDDENIDPTELADVWRRSPKEKLMEHKLYCDQQAIVTTAADTELPSPLSTNNAALETLRSQNAHLVNEIGSLKKTLKFLLVLQIVTIIMTLFIQLQRLLWK
ncbi:hypothetical protein CHUAL_000905 [Chamberlinius hualienensis]